MGRRHIFGLALAALVSVATVSAPAQGLDERDIVVEAGQVLREIMAIPARGIPRSLLHEAQGLVVIPGMIRGGFIVGVKRGRGIALSRGADGQWTNPVFVTITGGNIGFQAGLQSTDLVLVFRNRTSIERLMRGQFTIGANAAAAAGPVGRSMSAATDAQLRAEILSYSRSRGLFAGVAIDGAVMNPDLRATAAFYNQTPANPQGVAPDVATQFLRLVNQFSGTPTETPIPIVHDDRNRLCQQLIASHQRLAAIIDPAWQQFLALPTDLFCTSPAAMEQLRVVHTRYNTVAADPQFRALVERQEFQETLTLLNRHFLLTEACTNNVIALPSPPR